MDRLFTRKDALNRSESYQYDPAGNLTTFTDRKTQPATFTYDALNRRTRADYADSSFTTFTYDAVGRLTRATDSTSGSIDFFYDNLDRLILEVTPLGAVAYEYDAIGRRTKMTVAGQAPVTYQYDAASRLTQAAQGSLVVGLGYDAAGRRTSLTYPNGTSTAYTYDNASRLLTITHNGPGGIIEALTYAYDAAGNRTSLNRSNGTASLLPTAVASATYDAANQQTQFAGVTHTFDTNGNLTHDGTNTYGWDARNRLVNISGGATANFSYDPFGRRLSKTLGGVTRQYLYSGNDIAIEFQGGAATASYLRSLNVDEQFIRQAGAAREYYHADALGSSLVLSGPSGDMAATYAFEPYGKTTVTGGSTNPFQFTNRENDETGVYYYRARYYSPKLQRFLGEDPLGLRGGDINLYAYVRNAPTLFTDPQGLYLGPWHYVMSFYAAWAEGCTLKASHAIASADVGTDSDFNAFDPQLAYIHGQIPPGMSTVEAILAANQFVIDQLKTDSLKGLGRALHATEDPQAGGHLWTPYSSNPSSWWEYVTQAPYWAEHLFYDTVPFGIGESIARDRAVVKRYKDMGKSKAARVLIMLLVAALFIVSAPLVSLDATELHYFDPQGSERTSLNYLSHGSGSIP